jgi:hypothetical protein
MAINEAQFDSESELQDWAFKNIGTFLPRVILIPGFQISTTSGKFAVPDGFAFNFVDREWHVVECELLVHGVWPHIAEQITRFVVGLQNPETIRKIRDRIFEHIVNSGRSAPIVTSLSTTPERLLQQIELFVEGISPRVTIFIDKTDQDLEDMARALEAETTIFRVQKFIVNGQAEYYSPDGNAPAIETEHAADGEVPASDFDIIELLGGGKLEASEGRFKCYRLTDGSIVNIKKSRLYHEQNYWYGISSPSLQHIREHKVQCIVFVMGDFGLAKVPVPLIEKYLKDAYTTANPDGTVRHYHVYISHDPNPKLFYSNKQDGFSIADYFVGFD